MTVVGITGRKYHGKDTAATHFRAEGYKHLRFADPLKQMMRAFYFTAGCDPSLVERKLEGDLKETPCEYLCGKTPRHAMQTLGTEWGRGCIDDTLWVATLQRRAGLYDLSVVSDMRFPNECAAIEDLGGTTIRIDAARRVHANDFSNHPSETAVDTLPVHHVLDNNGSPEMLRDAVNGVIKNLVNARADTTER